MVGERNGGEQRCIHVRGGGGGRKKRRRWKSVAKEIERWRNRRLMEWEDR